LSDHDLIEDLVAAEPGILSNTRAGCPTAISAPAIPDTGSLPALRSMPPALITAADIIAFDLDGNPVHPGETQLFYRALIHGEAYRRART